MLKSRKSILVTGASSGIGKYTSLELDRMGFKVFAGVRTLKDANSIQREASKLLKPIILDVTDEDSIKRAFNIILKEDNYLFFGLINNAGIGLRSVLEIIPKEEFKRVFDVNVIGLHSITREFLPILRKNKGRIINIGSVTGLISSPGGGVYSASKFAVRAISDALRIELIPFGVSVSYIAPTSVESAIWEKNEKVSNLLRMNISSELLKAYSYFFKAQDTSKERIKPLKSKIVIDDIVDALISKNPKYEYYSGEEAVDIYKMSLSSKDKLIDSMIKQFTEYIRIYA